MCPTCNESFLGVNTRDSNLIFNKEKTIENHMVLLVLGISNKAVYGTLKVRFSAGIKADISVSFTKLLDILSALLNNFFLNYRNLGRYQLLPLMPSS